MVHTPGTEDEYGSCWGFGSTFCYPYCGYLQNEKGNNLVYRWYLANPVRFRQSLKVEIQDICKFGPGADDFTSCCLLVSRGTASIVHAATLFRTHSPKQRLHGQKGQERG